jgi:hypothetical protein
MKSFKERLAAIEAALRRKPGAGMFTIWEISGGLPCPVNFAYAGDLRWDRADGEDMDAFIRRSADAAIEAGHHMSLIVGGLPKGDEYSKYRKPDGEFDFDAWWEAECAPTYSEVPPVTVGYNRPASPVSRMLDRDR